MASSKGGSGKTVLTATFAAFLVGIGKRVLMIDTDAATNGLTLLYLKEVMTRAEFAIANQRKPLGTYEISAGDPAPEIVELPTGAHLIPATYAFSNTEDKSVGAYSAALAALILKLKSDYDYVFLDAQAGSDNFAHVAMGKSVCDEVIIVSEYDPMSAAGVERLKALFREDLTYPRTWVLLNKMLPDFVKSFSDFMEVAKYLSPIPWDAEVVRAYARRRLALDLQRGNEHTLAVMQTLKALLGTEVEADIDRWARERESAIRSPIKQQYLDLEKELQGLMMEERRLDLKQVRQKVVVFGALFGSVMAVAGVLVVSGSEIRQEIQKLFSSEYAVTVIMFLVSLIAVVTTIFSSEGVLARLFPWSGTEVRRVRRQQQLIEEKLKRLESVKQSSLETLLKTKL